MATIAPGGKIVLNGDKDLMRALDTLGTKIYKRVIQKANERAARPVVKTAKAILRSNIAKNRGGSRTKAYSRRTKNLEKSIGLTTRKYGHSGTIFTAVGPRIKGKQLGYHGHLVEFGHAIRSHAIGTKEFTDKRGRTRTVTITGLTRRGVARVPAYPFMRPAFAQHAQQQLRAHMQYVWEHIQKEARKGAKRA